MFGQIAQMKLPTNVKRYYEGDLWSTYYFANGATVAGLTRELFKTPTGTQGQGYPAVLAIDATNMSEGGRIASGLAYTVRQVAIEPRYDDCYAVCGADLRMLQGYCVPTWKFLNVFVEVAPVSLIGQGGGIFGSTADTGANEGGAGGTRFFANNGAGQTWVYHELPVLLPANTTFSLNLVFGTSAPAVDGGINNSNLLVRAHLIGVATSAVAEG